jgi:hypothetical protein
MEAASADNEHELTDGKKISTVLDNEPTKDLRYFEVNNFFVHCRPFLSDNCPKLI